MDAVKTNKYNWCLPGIILFGLFMASLHPTITAGDSGEIAAAAFSLGISHPPGYPLYAAIANSLAGILPLGSIVYRVNIISAVFGAASCWMVYLLTLKIVGAGLVPAKEGQPQELPLRLAAFFAAASLAFSHEFWYRSTVAEVYTLNTFLLLLIIYLLMVWREKNSGQWPVAGSRGMERGLSLSGGTGILPVITGRDAKFCVSTPVPPTGTGTVPGSANSRLLFLAAFLLGLSIGNHHTIVLIMPGVILFILWSVIGGQKAEGRSQKSGATLIAHCSLLIAFFLLGISIYLYLPVRSLKNPLMDWGDPQNLHNFIDVFIRRSYLPQGVERGWEMLLKQLMTFNPIHEFTIIGFIFGMFGLGMLWKTDRGMVIMLATTFILASYGLILLAGSSTKDVELLKKFYLPAYAIFSILIGTGIAAAIKSRAGNMRSIAQSLAVASLVWQLVSHYPQTWNNDNYLAYDYGMNELNSIPGDSMYISKGDIKTFPLWYLQGVERYREDVRVIAAYFLLQGWYAKETLRLVSFSLPAEGVNYKQMLIEALYRGDTGKGVYTGFLDQEYIPGKLLAHNHGITFMLHETLKEKPEGDAWSLYQMRGVRRLDRDMERGIREIFKDYASSYYNTGLRYYGEGEIDRAMADFEKAAAIKPDEPDFLNNLAALYAEKGVRLKEAEVMTRRAIELYTGEEDKAIARETLGEVLKKRNVETGL